MFFAQGGFQASMFQIQINDVWTNDRWSDIETHFQLLKSVSLEGQLTVSCFKLRVVWLFWSWPYFWFLYQKYFWLETILICGQVLFPGNLKWIWKWATLLKGKLVNPASPAWRQKDWHLTHQLCRIHLHLYHFLYLATSSTPSKSSSSPESLWGHEASAHPTKNDPVPDRDRQQPAGQERKMKF